MSNNGRLANGFTLAEILISTLLLSIFAVGTFKSSQFTQTTATATFWQFKFLHLKKQAIEIRGLADRYSAILVDDDYQELQCLIRQLQIKQLKPNTDCN